MSGDQLHFFGLAAILVFSSVNTFFFNQKYGWKKAESFWLGGMMLLGLSCFSFGVSPFTNRAFLALGNIALLCSYLALILQLRYWKSGQEKIPLVFILFAISYLPILELIRAFNPSYAYRSLVVHSVMCVLTTYLAWSSSQLFRKTKSPQLALLTLTFVIEAVCTFLRAVIPFAQPEAQTMNWFTEESWMNELRWIWTTTNVVTYLSILAFQLEKSTDQTELLRDVICEKDQLLRAATMVNRSQNASIISASIMHELRQPLATMLLGSTALHAALSDEQPDSSLLEFTSLIEKESKRSVDVMKKLEAIYTPDRSLFGRTSIPELIESSVNRLAHRTEVTHVIIKKSYLSHTEVSGDPVQLETVITNLISNAIKALSGQDSPRLVSISVTEQDGFIHTEVKDNGPGIDPTILPNIWNLFVSKSEGGTGIGLWLSKTIISNHHGELSARNLEGGGASFQFSIPIAS
ncbi:MFS domain-containing histidine kinase [Zwartia sp.]|uniref:MFS domain-containing histidine kinase n=1 Tax=Zwartia sp. TaxID=2978004 RepID=UPI00272836AA|nr:MFS domain-containing histidine kinase [Zwartia sp.]MDO9025491.1 MFS domain-containing histidine kinase [Zwartia sp.]